MAGIIDFAAIKDIFANGAVSLSASSGSDAVVTERDGYSMGGSVPATIVANWIPGLSTTKLSLAIAACSALLHHPKLNAYFDPELKRTAAAPAKTNQDATELLKCTTAEFTEAQRIGLILAVASKVNWWKIGHHTGQGALVGYLVKAAKILDVQITTKEDIAAVWRLGHWFDTRRVLHALGVPEIAATDRQGNIVPFAPIEPANVVFEVGPEVSRRIASNPAGTAKLADCVAAIDAVKVIPAVNLIESVNLGDLPKWRSSLHDVANHPARFHVGSKYLTGREQVIVPTPPEFVFVWLKSVLEATGASATLLEAQCFKNVGVNIGVIKAIKALSETSTGARPDKILTLAHFTDGAEPVAVAGADKGKEKEGQPSSPSADQKK